MATTGSYENKFHGGSSGGYYLGIRWTVNSQSAATNSSNVTATVYIRSSGSGYSISSSASKNISFTINGTVYTATNTVGIGENTTKDLLTKTVTVNHNSDGTKSCAFASTVGVNVTLGGTYYGNVSTSGTGTFNTIILNTAPTLSGTVTVSPNGIISEAQASVTVSWPAASDSNLEGYRVQRYVNGSLATTLWPGNVTSFSDTISSYGQGTSIYYAVSAYDTADLYSGTITSSTITKNTFTKASITSFSASIGFATTSFTVNYSGASNTSGNTSNTFECYSDDITVYNQTYTSALNQAITVYKTGTLPSVPYIKFDDLKAFLASSNYNGTLHIGLRSKNYAGTVLTSGSSIAVDLRTAITVAAGSTSINASSYYTVNAITYLVPGRKQITLNWPIATDPLGTAITYRIEQSTNSGSTWSTLLSSTSAITYSFNKTVTGKPTYMFRVVARNGYGYESVVSGTPSGILYSYSAPNVSISSQSRTANAQNVVVAYSYSTEIPGNGVKTLSWVYEASNGAINTTTKTFDITGLTEANSGTFTVTIEDTIASALGQSPIAITGSVSQFYPILSLRKTGVGINTLPDGVNKLSVSGGAKVDGLIVHSSSTKASILLQNTTNIEGEQPRIIFRSTPTGVQGVHLRFNDFDGTQAPFGLHLERADDNTQTTLKAYLKVEGDIYSDGAKVLTVNDKVAVGTGDPRGKIAHINTDGVMEVGKYIDFHDNSATDYDARITCTGTALSMNGNLSVTGTLYANSNLSMTGYIALPANGTSWINGATLGNIRGSKQSTGSYHPMLTQTTSSNHKVSLGGLGDDFGFHFYDATRVDNGVDSFFRFNYPNNKITTDMDIQTNQWFRATGNTGFYFEDWGGGWFMTDNTWIRSYGDKNIYTGNTIKSGTMETRWLKGSTGTNLDIAVDGAGSIYFNVNSTSGCALYLNDAYSGGSGTEPSLYNNKGVGWGWLGSTTNSFYRVYGAGGSVSDRAKKYDITKADIETQYENIKNLNIYNYRTISDKRDEETGEIIEQVYRQDLMLGTMVDELPTECTFYDNEGGDGKSVDMYSYTSMILGASKHIQVKVEAIEDREELTYLDIQNLKQENLDLKERVSIMEGLINGIINGG